MFNRRGMLRPILPGYAEKDLRTVLIDTPEGGCLSEDTPHGTGKCWGQMLILVDARKGLFQTIHSVPQSSRCDIFVPV